MNLLNRNLHCVSNETLRRIDMGFEESVNSTSKQEGNCRGLSQEMEKKPSSVTESPKCSCQYFKTTNNNWSVSKQKLTRIIAGLYNLIPILPICFHERSRLVQAFTFSHSITIFTDDRSSTHISIFNLFWIICFDFFDPKQDG